MADRSHPTRLLARAATLVLLAALVVPAGLAPSATAAGPEVSGSVVTATGPRADVAVTWFEAGAGVDVPAIALAHATTDASGRFDLVADRAPAAGAVSYLLADDRVDGTGGPVVLAAALGTAPLPPEVVINERTTVATAFAFAPFLTGDSVGGIAPGPANAVAMSRNVVDPVTGEPGTVLTTSPNGTDTSTWAAFGSLVNVAAGCTTSLLACDAVLAATTAPGEPTPTNLLQAFATVARNPEQGRDALYALSLVPPAPESPALDHPPAAWLLALRFVGDGHSIAGPGNFAIDHDGNVYAANNYQYAADPHAPVCGSDLLLKFAPDGSYPAGAPLSGGGLSGAGFGVAIDPYGDIWVANYGFAAPPPGCPDDQQPPHNSMSQFTGDGTPVSPSAGGGSTGGWTQGNLSWPQGTAADEDGTIWVANCGNDTVTRIPEGDPTRAESIGDLGLHQPFDVDVVGDRVLVTGAASSTVAVLDRTTGQPIAGSPITGGGLDHPFGLAADRGGNVWVANSGVLDFPCPDRPTEPLGRATLSLLGPDGTPQRDAGFTGGGLTLPWGVAIDGDDNVWVGNFAGKRVSKFCGTRPETCPAGKTTGDPISPDVTGYFFDGLERTTGLAVDPSGNLWVTNNWLEVPFQTNPGGHEVVVFVGVAAPVVPDAPVSRPEPAPAPTPAPTPSTAAVAVVVDPRFTG